jgi:hypothetical protein
MRIFMLMGILVSRKKGMEHGKRPEQGQHRGGGQMRYTAADMRRRKHNHETLACKTKKKKESGECVQKTTTREHAREREKEREKKKRDRDDVTDWRLES